MAFLVESVALPSRYIQRQRFLFNTAKRLGITSFNLHSEIITLNLKEAKTNYMQAKKYHQLDRDRYVSENSDQASNLRKIRVREKQKLKLKKHRKYFGKRRMNSISQVEHFSGSTFIRVSSQFDIKSSIMK